MEIVDFDKAFASLVDEAALKQRLFRAPFVVGPTPELLQSLGYRSCPVLMPSSVVHKAREQHGISIDDIKSIPRQLRDPVAVFESDTQPNSINILTDFRNRDGKPVTIAIDLNSVFGRDKAHKVATITERNEAQVELWKVKGLVVFEDTEKQKTRIQSAGLQLPGEGSTSKVTIPRRNKNVNSLSDAVGENPQAGQGPRKVQTQYAGLQLPGEGSTPKASIPQKTVPEGDFIIKAREETQSRLFEREDISKEEKVGVQEFLNLKKSDHIWKSQTLDADGRIAAARVLGGLATFDDATKGLPEIQHGVIRALGRAQVRVVQGPQNTH